MLEFFLCARFPVIRVIFTHNAIGEAANCVVERGVAPGREFQREI